MVYRTPCPPPEEPKMKEPFEWQPKHTAILGYVFFWITAIMIFLGHQDTPHAIEWLVGSVSALHGIGCAIVLAATT